MPDEQLQVVITASIEQLITALAESQSAITSSLDGMKGSVDSLSESFDSSLSTAAQGAGEHLGEVAHHAEEASEKLAEIAELMKVGLEIVGLEVGIELFHQLAEALTEASARAVDLRNLSLETGLATNEIQGLNAIAAETGVSTNTLERGIFRLNQTLLQAGLGSKSATEKLHHLGITDEEIADKNFVLKDALEEVSAKVNEMGVNSNSAALVMDVMGRKAADATIVLDQLHGSFETAGEKAKEVDAINRQTIETLIKFHEETATLQEKWENFKATLLVNLMPAVEAIVSGFTRVINAAKDAAHWIAKVFGSAKAESVETLDEKIADLEKKIQDRLAPKAVGRGRAPKAEEDGSEPAKYTGRGHVASNVSAMREELEALKQKRDALKEVAAAKEKAEAPPKAEWTVAAGGAEMDEAEQRKIDLMRSEGDLKKKIDADILKSDKEMTKGLEKNIHEYAAAQMKTLQEIDKAHDKLVKDLEKKYAAMMHPVTNAITHSMKGVMQGTQTMAQAMKNIWNSIAASIIDTLAQMVTQHMAAELAKTTATEVGAGARTAAESTAGTMSMAQTAKAAIANITTKAAETIASVYNALAGIPYVGPFLAPAMAFAAGALVVGLIGRVASAEGGWEVPSDQLAMVHENEMILPAPISKGLKGLISSGGSGGGGQTVNLTVQAIDAQSMRSAGPKIAASLATQLQRFNPNMRRT